MKQVDLVPPSIKDFQFEKILKNGSNFYLCMPLSILPSLQMWPLGIDFFLNHRHISSRLRHEISLSHSLVE